jgi:hypothetical protein
VSRQSRDSQTGEGIFPSNRSLAKARLWYANMFSHARLQCIHTMHIPTTVAYVERSLCVCMCVLRTFYTCISQADEIQKKHPHDKILNAVHALEDDQQAKRHMMCVMLHRRCVQPFLSVLIIENRLEQASAVGFVCLRVFHDTLPLNPHHSCPLILTTGKRSSMRTMQMIGHVGSSNSCASSALYSLPV